MSPWSGVDGVGIGIGGPTEQDQPLARSRCVGAGTTCTNRVGLPFFPKQRQTAGRSDSPPFEAGLAARCKHVKRWYPLAAAVLDGPV
eukprot:12366956-Alexandrium_andersonii.AAC.1